MRVAVVGMGVIGNVHTQILLEQNKKLVAICDCDEEKLNGYPNVKGYTDYQKMLDEVKPDIVHICTPHYLHADMVITALKNNVNVLCEKPLCIREEDIPRILEAEKNSSAQLGVCFQNRYTPANGFLKEYLADKRVQAVWANLVWNRGQSYYDSSAWRGKKSMEGGGVLINQFIHTIDLLEWLVGEPESLTAVLSNMRLKDVIEVEDTACLYSNGEVKWLLFASNANDKDFPVEMCFATETERIRVRENQVEINGVSRDFTVGKRYYGKPCYGVGHAPLIEHFHECVNTGEKFPIDGAEAAKAVRFVLAAYASEGKEVKIEK